MLSKEDYISQVVSGKLPYVPRMKAKDLKTITEADILKQKLVPVSKGVTYKYDTHINNEKVIVYHNSGITSKANTIVNNYDNFIEIVHYKDDFNYVRGRHEEIYNTQGEKLLKENMRLFAVQDGVLIPRRSINWDKVGISNMKSLHRAKDNFYGYALCRSNNWKYFVTFTFSPKRVNRYDDDAVKKVWGIFSKALKRISKDVTILVTPERHEKSPAIHFHGFIGNINLSRYLSLARGNKNQPLRSKCGELLYNLSLFKYGYSTVAILPDEYDEKKIANYCINYVTKSNRIGYNKKAYFRTRNLYFKDKVVTHYTDGEFTRLINDMGLQCVFVKQTDKIQVYHIQKAPQ